MAGCCPPCCPNSRLRNSLAKKSTANEFAIEIERRELVDQLVAGVERAAVARTPLLVVAPPSQGKSWACHQLNATLAANGLALREARIDRGLSQEGLASLCGLDRTYVSGIERGERNPSLTNLLRLVGALETTMSAIAARAEALVR